MANKTQKFWSPLKIISAIVGGFIFVGQQLIGDRLTSWGNDIIDKWFLKYRGEIVTWIFQNPANLMMSITFIIFLILLIDFAFWYKKNYDKNDIDSKEDDSSIENKEIVFRRTYNHQEFDIYNSTPEQVLLSIRKSMSSSLWTFSKNGFAYDVSYEDSRFYYPERDNVVVYGAFVQGIKYELEKRKDGIENRRNGTHIPKLFWISITPIGIGEGSKLQVDFETQDKEAVEFFNVMKTRLREFKIITNENKNPQIRQQKFIWRNYHAEYKVNAGAEIVKNYLLQQYTGISEKVEHKNITLMINGVTPIEPKQAEDTFQHGFIVFGIKQISGKPLESVAGISLRPVLSLEQVPEMFFVTLIQSAKDVSIVWFDTDIKEAVSFSEGLLQGLKTGFIVEVIRDIDGENKNTNGKVVKWDRLSIVEFVFPEDSHFGLGLQVVNESGRKINLLSAELVYLIKSETKSILSINRGESYLPWAVDNRSRVYEPQTIKKGETKALIVLNWNKVDNEVWFPTEPLDPSKQTRIVKVNPSNMNSNKSYFLTNNRTYLKGKGQYYFEVELRAKNRKNNFIYKGSIIIDDKGNIKYA